MLASSSGTCSRAKGGRSRGRHVQNHTDYMLSPVTSGTALPSSTLSATCALNNNLLNLAAGGVQQERQMYNSVTSTGYQNSVSISNGDVVENSSPAITAGTVNGKVNDDYELVLFEYFMNFSRHGFVREKKLKNSYKNHRKLTTAGFLSVLGLPVAKFSSFCYCFFVGLVLIYML